MRQFDDLMTAAKNAAKFSYAPYSDFNVGAALLTASGKIYTGCNVENAAFTPTVCAERVAFFKAISDGERDFVAIAVAGSKSGVSVDGVTPCGVCRQVMAEFCVPDKFTVCVAVANGYETYTLSELLPHGFGSDSMKG